MGQVKLLVRWLLLSLDARVDEGDAAPQVSLRPSARLYQYAIGFAFVIGFLLLFPTPFMPLGLGGVVFLMGLRGRALGSPVPHTRVNGVLLVLFASILWGMLRAPNVGETVLTVARLLAGVVTFFLIVDYTDHPARVWNVAAALVGLGVVTAFAAPFVTEPTTAKFLDVSWLFNSSFPHLWDVSNANMVGGTLAAVVPLALALLSSQTRALRAVGGFALVPLLGMQLLLQARGAILALVVGILVYASLYKRWFLAVAPILVLAVLLLNGLVPKLLPKTVNADAVSNLLSLEGRQVVWEFAAKQLVREPLGIGVDGYRRYADNLASDSLTLPQRQHAHNIYLQVGLDTGFIGLASFCVLLAFALYAAWHAYRNAVKRELAAGLLAALVIVMLHGLLEPNMWGNKAGVVLWSLLGMAVGLSKFGARRRHRQRGTRMKQAAEKA